MIGEDPRGFPKPLGISRNKGEMMNVYRIGGLLGGGITALTTFLVLALMCPGLCDSPPVLAGLWLILIANFTLGYAAGYVLMRFWETKWVKALVLIAVGLILGFPTTIILALSL